MALQPPVAGDDFEIEHAFVGPDPSHGLRDAWREVLAERGRLETLPPGGPLAVSHVLRSGAGHRMDRIYASGGLDPVGGGYDLDGGSSAGSDHALHWIDFAERQRSAP